MDYCQPDSGVCVFATTTGDATPNMPTTHEWTVPVLNDNGPLNIRLASSGYGALITDRFLTSWQVGSHPPLAAPGTHLLAALAYLNNDQTLIWSGMLAGSGTSRISASAAAFAGPIVVAGEAPLDVDFDLDVGTTTVSAPDDTSFVASYGLDGTLLWVRRYLGPPPTHLTVLDDGSVLVMGDHMTALEFDGLSGPVDLAPLGVQNLWLARLNASGQAVWLKTIAHSGAAFTSVRGPSVGSDGAIAVAASYSSPVTVGAENSPPPVGVDGFVTRLYASGDHAWTHFIASEASVFVSGTAHLGSAVVLSAGFGTSAVTFGVPPKSKTFTHGQGATATFEANGTLRWAVGLSSRHLGLLSGQLLFATTRTPWFDSTYYPNDSSSIVVTDGPGDFYFASLASPTGSLSAATEVLAQFPIAVALADDHAWIASSVVDGESLGLPGAPVSMAGASKFAVVSLFVLGSGACP
jgi:hypothetical protein